MLVEDFHEAYQCASRQFKASNYRNAIGVRGTPVVSIWPMKEKWKKFGQWFTTIGTDGVVTVHEHWFCDWTDRKEYRHRKVVEPLMLQLYYVVLGNGDVLQLAWIRPDLNWKTDRWIRSEKMTVRL